MRPSSPVAFASPDGRCVPIAPAVRPNRSLACAYVSHKAVIGVRANVNEALQNRAVAAIAGSISPFTAPTVDVLHTPSRNGGAQARAGSCWSGRAMKTLSSVRHAILRLVDADGEPRCLAMEVVFQPRDHRDRLIRGRRTLYCDGIAGSGQSRQRLGILGDVLEAKLREAPAAAVRQRACIRAGMFFAKSFDIGV